MSVCEVLSCKSRNDSGRMYHGFPSDPVRRKEWLKSLGQKKVEIKTHSTVCSKHFRSRDYYPGGKRLLPDTVPRLRLDKCVPKDNRSNKSILQKRSDKERSKQCNKSGKQRKSAANINASNIRTSKLVQSNPKKVPYVDLGSKTNLNASNISAAKKGSSKQIISNKNDTVLLAAQTQLDVNSRTKQQRTINRKVSTPQQRNILQVCRSSNIKGKKTFVSTKYKKGKNSKDIKEFSTTGNKRLLQSKTIQSSRDGQVISNECIIPNQYNLEGLESIKKTQAICKVNVNVQDNLCSTITRAKSSKINLKLLPETNKSKSDTEFPREGKSIIRSYDDTDFGIEANRNATKKRRLLTSCSENPEAPVKEMYVKGSSLQQCNSCFDEHKGASKQNQNKHNVDSNITNIEQTILEMQNKIKKLEKKSILDEIKIEKFKKALIQQRNNDIKVLMDEKENELLLRMDLLYLDYDPQRICRLCLLLVDKKEALTSLAWSPGLISLIENSTNIQIVLEDDMPSGICSECLQQTRRVDWIRRRTQRSNMLIKKFLSMKKAFNEDNNGTGTPTGINLGNEKSQFNDDLFEEEVTDVLKIEKVFSLENPFEIPPLDCVSVKQEIESDEENSRISLREEPSAMYHEYFSAGKPGKCKRCNTTFFNQWSLNKHIRYCEQNQKFQCSECGKCFWNSQLFKMHKLRLQCICEESKRRCYDCQIVFRWKWQLVFHVYQHNCPKSCELCDEILHSIDHLKHHVVESHLS